MTEPVEKPAAKELEAAGPAKNGLQRLGQIMMSIGAWPGMASSWLILPVILCVLAAVLGGIFRLSQLATWDQSILLLGDQLSIIGLTELQWHLFAVMVMLGGAYALHEDRHVRVDMLYEKVSPKWRARVDVIGDLIFLLPFCAIVAWLSLRFVDMAIRSGEQSDYGGLIDRYLVKSILPIGLGLLFLTGLGRVLRNIGFLLSKQHPAAENSTTNNG
jgi:TRAP-type mannitol/chloroaromatic compound transport system permease small subunit